MTVRRSDRLALPISKVKFQVETCFVVINYILDTHRVVSAEVNLPLCHVRLVWIPYGNLDEAFEWLGISLQSEQTTFVYFNLLTSRDVEIGEVNLSIIPLRMTSLSSWLLKCRIEQNRIVAEPAYHEEALLEQRIDERLF